MSVEVDRIARAECLVKCVNKRGAYLLCMTQADGSLHLILRRKDKDFPEWLRQCLIDYKPEIRQVLFREIEAP